MIYLFTLNKNWGIFLILASLVISIRAGNKSHWSIGALLFWMLASAIIYSTGLFQALAIISFVTALTHTKARVANIVEVLLALLCLLSCMATLVLTPHGLSGNPSMNGCLIAILLPFMIRVFFGMPALGWIGISSAAILKTGASIPVGALAASLGGMTLSQHGVKAAFRSLLIIAPIIAISIGIAGPAEFFSSTGRTWFWGHIWEWFSSSGNILLGHGTGALDIVLRSKMATDPQFKTVIWAHNDYLQVLFDNGLLGISLLAIAMYQTIKRSIDRPHLFGAMSAFAATALLNFPMHVPLHAAIGSALIWMAYASH